MSYASTILADGPSYWTRFADPARPVNEVGPTPATAAYVADVTPAVPGPVDKALRLHVDRVTAEDAHLVYGDAATVLAPGTHDFGSDDPPYGAVAIEFWVKIDTFHPALVYLYSTAAKLGNGTLYLAIQQMYGVFLLRVEFIPTFFTSGTQGPSGFSGYVTLPVMASTWHHCVFNLCAAAGQIGNTYNDFFFDGEDQYISFDTGAMGYLPDATMDPAAEMGLYSDLSAGVIDLALAELAVYVNTRLSPQRVAAHIAAALGGTGLGAKRIPLLGVG